MSCIKTGCVAFLTQYNEWVYGDAYQYGDNFVIRAVMRTRDKSKLSEFGRVRHFTVFNIFEWFEKDQTSQQIISTIIAPNDDVINHGYEGMLDPELKVDNGQG